MSERYAADLAAIEHTMLAEAERWQPILVDTKIVESAIFGLLSRPGKRLRPILALTVCSMLGGDTRRVYSGAASAEIYHSASLIFDDIQDNSSSRGGGDALFAILGPSAAINIAGIIRSLSYHVISHCETLDDHEKFDLQRRLDTVSTLIPAGQSIDIGWSSGRYRSISTFPYEAMARRKTGALFDYCAWSAARVSGADIATADRLAELAADIGLLYQKIDDFHDTFTTSPEDAEDIREGKANFPVTVLAEQLTRIGEETLLAEIFRFGGNGGRPIVDRDLLISLLDELRIADIAREQLHITVTATIEHAEQLQRDIGGGPDLAAFVSTWHQLL